DSIYVNGSQAQYSVSGSTVTVTADKIPSGDNTLTYKLKETSVHGDTTTPISNGTIHYDKSNGSFKSSVNIPNAHLAGNANSELCVTKVNKFVSKGDSGDFTDSIDLDEMNETFTYKLEYQFGEDVAGADTVQLKDELVS